MRAGFTLIELLVVFSLIATLSGIGFASFASYSHSQQVNQTANDIKLLVNEARANALSAVKASEGFNCNDIGQTLVGYSVNVIGSNKLGLNQICDNKNNEIKVITLPKNINFVSSAAGVTDCTTIQFDSLSSTSTGTPCSLTIEGFSLQKVLSIDTIGNVSIK
jgi:prepilin-type N-terminal cleavage/methylation domain-containing protein